MAALSWASARVLKASHEITSGQKLVWLEILSLDQGPERCFVSGPRLAQRLGMPLNTLERVRRELKDLGLVATAGGGRRGATWWPELPPQFIPRQRSPTDTDVIALADALDGWLRIRQQDAADNGVNHDAIPPPKRASPMTPFPEKKGITNDAISAPAASPASIAAEGEVGGGGSKLQKSVKTSPSSASQREDGGKAEDGARARANGEEGGPTRSPPPGWRSSLESALGPRPGGNS